VAGVVPVPVRETVSGLLVALLVTVRDPVRVPDAVAPYLTETVQFAPAARLDPQVLVCENGPVVATEEIAAAAVPVLVTVTVWAALVEPTVVLPNVSDVGEADSVADEAAAPVPVSETDVGLLVALLLTVKDPVWDPDAVGVNVTETVQFAPAARLDPQVLVCANGPVAETDEIVAAAVPELVTVTVWAALVEPTVVLPNVSDVGEADSVAVPPDDPLPGKISNSESCAADQPVLAVKLSSTYSALVPDGRLIVTVLPVDGLNVYPADATIWLNVEPLLEPSTERVSVLVLQADDGGRSKVMDPID
jgi:hypothetical protein